MTLDELKAAVNEGHKASSVLSAVLHELLEKHYCPESSGFEGPETFPDCGKCVYCLAKQLMQRPVSL